MRVQFASSQLAQAVRRRCRMHDPSRRCVRWLHPPHTLSRVNDSNAYRATYKSNKHARHEVTQETNFTNVNALIHDADSNNKSNINNNTRDGVLYRHCHDVHKGRCVHSRTGNQHMLPRLNRTNVTHAVHSKLCEDAPLHRHSDADPLPTTLLLIHNLDCLPVSWLRRCVLPLCRRFADPHPHLRLLVSVDHPHGPDGALVHGGSSSAAAAARSRVAHAFSTNPPFSDGLHNRTRSLASTEARGHNSAVLSRGGASSVSAGHALDELPLIWLELRDWLLPRVHEMRSVDALTVLTRAEAGAAGRGGGGGACGEGLSNLWGERAAHGGGSLSGTGGGGGVMYDTMRRILFSLPTAFAELLQIMIHTQEEHGEGHYVSLFTHQDGFERHGVMVSQGRMRALQRELTSNRLAVYDAAEHAMVLPQHRKLLRVLQEVTARRVGEGGGDAAARLSGFADVTRT